jgi:hypothetical protein
MTTRLPLVIVNGRVQQLQSGEVLGGLNSGQVRNATNVESSLALTIGMPVYAFSADSVKAGKADASASSRIIGLWRETVTTNGVLGDYIPNGILSATTSQWDSIAGTSGGLTPGAAYYLSSTVAGNITSVAPSASGSLIVELGIAVSPTDIEVSIKSPILL